MEKRVYAFRECGLAPLASEETGSVATMRAEGATLKLHDHTVLTEGRRVGAPRSWIAYVALLPVTLGAIFATVEVTRQAAISAFGYDAVVRGENNLWLPISQSLDVWWRDSASSLFASAAPETAAPNACTAAMPAPDLSLPVASSEAVVAAVPAVPTHFIFLNFAAAPRSSQRSERFQIVTGAVRQP